MDCNAKETENKDSDPAKWVTVRQVMRFDAPTIVSLPF